MPYFSLASFNSSQFLFNLRFLNELMHKVNLSKTVCGIFHFWFRFIFMKVFFFQQKAWTLSLLTRNTIAATLGACFIVKFF